MAKFTPTQKKVIDKKSGKERNADLYKATKWEEMISFIKANGTAEEIAKFKKAASEKFVYVDSGKKKKNGEPLMVKTDKVIACGEDEVNILGAKKVFFEMYAPEFLPKKTPKAKVNARKLLDEL